MKIVGISDIHIHAYTNYSVIDEHGIPSRLKQYDYLAQDLVSYANNIDAKIFVIAGDLVQSAVTTPAALDYAKNFINTLAEDCIVLIINGNHCVEAKGDDNSYHSVVAPLIDANNKNIIYVRNEDIVEIDGVSFYLRSWKSGESNYEDLKPADIGVLHGAITGCKDELGYEFKHGFNVEDLYKNYELAIVGDIHSPQSFVDTRTDHKAVIPGALVGNRFSDNLGHFITYDTDTKVVESVCIRELDNKKQYYYFRNNASPNPVELKQFPNTQYKPAKTTKTKKTSKNSVTVTNNVSLIDSIKTNINAIPIEYKTEILADIEKIYETVKIEYQIPAPTKAKFVSLDITNFLSVQGNVKIEFPRDEDEILIRGSGNGVGKSTLAEALYWVITNELTKSVAVTSITNDKSPKDTAAVTTKFSIDQDVYTVTRTRVTGSLLTLYKNDVNISKDSVAKTQELIYSILGFGKDELDAMLYFSLNESNLYTSLPVNKQLEFIAKLAQAEILEEIKTKFKLIIDGYNNAILTDSAIVSQTQSQIDRLNKRIQEYQYQQAAATTNVVDISKVQDNLNILEVRRNDLVEILEKLSETHTKAVENKQNIDKLVQTDAVVFNKIKQNKEQLTSLLQKRKVLSENKCYTCNHVLTDDSLLKDITDQIDSVSKRTKELALYQPQANEIQIMAATEELETVNVSLNKHRAELKEVNTTINNLQQTLANAKANNVDNTSIINAITVEINELNTELTKYNLEEISNKKNAYLQAIKLLESNNKNPVYTSSISTAYQNLLDNANKLLEPLGYMVSISKNYELLLKVDSGKERVVKALSGGERRLLDVVMLVSLGLAYQNLYQLDGPLLNLTIYDEVFTYLVESNIQYVYNLISGLPGIKVVISNEKELIAMFNHYIYVTKTEAGSQYSFNL